MKAKKIAAISSAIIFGTSTALAGMPTTTLAQEQTVTEETTPEFYHLSYQGKPDASCSRRNH